VTKDAATPKVAAKITTEPLFIGDRYGSSGFLSHEQTEYKPLNLHKDFTAHQDAVDSLNSQGNSW